jgi:hypothetical protein
MEFGLYPLDNHKCYLILTSCKSITTRDEPLKTKQKCWCLEISPIIEQFAAFFCQDLPGSVKSCQLSFRRIPSIQVFYPWVHGQNRDFHPSELKLAGLWISSDKKCCSIRWTASLQQTTDLCGAHCAVGCVMWGKSWDVIPAVVLFRVQNMQNMQQIQFPKHMHVECLSRGLELVSWRCAVRTWFKWLFLNWEPKYLLNYAFSEIGLNKVLNMYLLHKSPINMLIQHKIIGPKLHLNSCLTWHTLLCRSAEGPPNIFPFPFYTLIQYKWLPSCS